MGLCGTKLVQAERKRKFICSFPEVQPIFCACTANTKIGVCRAETQAYPPLPVGYTRFFRRVHPFSLSGIPGFRVGYTRFPSPFV